MASGHVQDSNEKKRPDFIPLENNPEVWSRLARSLDVSPELGFYDVLSLYEPELLAFIPRPAHALLVTCPGAVYRKARATEPQDDATYDGTGDNERVWWIKQTIPGACGSIGFLHALSNGSTSDFVQPGSDLHKFLSHSASLKPVDRAQALYDSDMFEKAHSSVAQLGDTVAPPDDSGVGNHYICFVKGRDGHLWELEGGWKGPLDRGALADDEDVLSEKALDLGVRKLFAHAGDAEFTFSIVALAPQIA